MEKIFIIVIVILLSACTLDYSDADLIQDLSEEIPNTIIYRYKTVEVQNGNPVLQIQADKAEIYNSKEQTFLTNVEFFNYKDEEISNHGISDSAVMNMKTGDAQLSGSIKIESLEDETYLKAESLSWIDDEKILSSNDEDYVTVKDGEGSLLKGQGFSADIKRKSIIFDGKTQGEYISDEN